ncbi:MAG: phosphoribosylformimino-5-aminoimidazole carboxamide ribotide isomerase [Lachnospiraceae bacterium]|nr:phosphoribosylformimino-5-aminoimidazole carboxamide ribotide isomerase [Lachnospiraceae bacterium]
MRFRPCIDIHNGKVKQIVGSSLTDAGAKENFVSDKGAADFAALYKEHGLAGGHIILLNHKDSEYYEATRREAISALCAYKEGMQIGGGVTDENGADYLDAGASHVIVTSFVFKDGKINETNLERLVRAVGKEHIVLDLSCKKVEGQYHIVTDRWQKVTDTVVCEKTLNELSDSCDEFLVHAADVEGKQSGIDEDLARLLGAWQGIPITYAGGIRSLEDIRLLNEAGDGRLDYTIGSALDLFGGNLKFEEVIRAQTKV